MHLPFSPGMSNDDKLIRSMEGFEGREIVITEKMDGENTTLYGNGDIHARSLDSRHHASRNWVKAFHSSIAHEIPEGIRICGENMYARHSIAYDQLDSYFLGFGAWDGDRCLDWDTTRYLFNGIGIAMVPELWRGPFNLKVLVDLACTLDITKHEGFVVRTVQEFSMREFTSKVAKWVRPGHVVTEDHWMHSEIVPNKVIF